MNHKIKGGKIMFKKLATFLAIVSLAVVVAGCGGASTGSKPAAKKADVKWPTKPIEMVAPFKAGGDTDFNARAYAKYLEKELGQTIVVVNTAGAGGSLAAEKVRDAKADGYKIFFANTGILLNNVTGISDYKITDAFDPVGIVGSTAGECIVVRKDFPANTVPELLKLTAKEPNKYKIASVLGGIMHYYAVRLNDLGGKMTIVDAGGTNDRIAALKGGHCDVIVNTIGTIWSYVKSGDFKVLAMTSEKRSTVPEYKDIPTCKEQGVDLALVLEYNMLMKKGTDPQIIEKLAAAVKKVSENPEYQKEIDKAYQQKPFVLSPKDSLARLNAQFDMFNKYRSQFTK